MTFFKSRHRLVLSNSLTNSDDVYLKLVLWTYVSANSKVASDYSEVSPWWNKVRDVLMASTSPLNALTAALACRSVAIRIECQIDAQYIKVAQLRLESVLSSCRSVSELCFAVSKVDGRHVEWLGRLRRFGESKNDERERTFGERWMGGGVGWQGSMESSYCSPRRCHYPWLYTKVSILGGHSIAPKTTSANAVSASP